MSSSSSSSSFLRASLVVAVCGLGIAIVAVMSLPIAACGDIPSKTCRGDQVNVYTKDGEADASTDCTTCLQRTCCDQVGFCGESAACTDQFKDAQACVNANGPRDESRCTTNLVDENAKSLYACMRNGSDKGAGCGPLCGIPSCNIDRSVVLFGSARCDRCASSACCDEINTCYQSRGCKLTLECILTKCTDGLGEGMKDLLKLNLDDATSAVCGNQQGANSFLSGGATDCIFSCLNDFAPIDGGTADDNLARCNAFKVYTCTAKSGCGDECSPEPSLSDASSDAH